MAIIHLICIALGAALFKRVLLISICVAVIQTLAVAARSQLVSCHMMCLLSVANYTAC